MHKGFNALKSSNNINNKIVIIDEVGNLELENKGWANSIQDLIKASNNHILLVVRDSLIEKVIQKWNFKQYFVYNIYENDHVTVSNLIIEHIN